MTEAAQTTAAWAARTQQVSRKLILEVGLEVSLGMSRKPTQEIPQNLTRYWPQNLTHHWTRHLTYYLPWDLIYYQSRSQTYQ